MISEKEAESIAECFRYVDQVGLQINALLDDVGNLLPEMMSTLTKEFRCVGKTLISSRYCDSGWVYSDESRSVPIRRKRTGKLKADYYICFQVSTVGDGINFPNNSVPLLHVGCFKWPVSFKPGEEYYVGYPLEDEVSFDGGRLARWRDLEVNSDEWLFSLKLCSLKDIADLKKYVVEPSLKLLAGCEVAEALPDEWLGQVLLRQGKQY